MLKFQYCSSKTETIKPVFD